MLNKTQKCIVATGTVCILAAGVYVPWQSSYGPAGYGLIFKPPDHAVHIDTTRMVIPMLLVAVVTGAGVWLSVGFDPPIRTYLRRVWALIARPFYHPQNGMTSFSIFLTTLAGLSLLILICAGLIALISTKPLATTQDSIDGNLSGKKPTTTVTKPNDDLAAALEQFVTGEPTQTSPTLTVAAKNIFNEFRDGAEPAKAKYAKATCIISGWADWVGDSRSGIVAFNWGQAATGRLHVVCRDSNWMWRYFWGEAKQVSLRCRFIAFYPQRRELVFADGELVE